MGIGHEIGALGGFVAWVLCAVLGWMIGARKGAGGTGAVLGLIFGPAGVALVLMLRGNRIDCPHCRSLIHPQALVCCACGRNVSAPTADRTVPAEPGKTPPAPEPSASRKCPHCRHRIPSGDTVCPYCETPL